MTIHLISPDELATAWANAPETLYIDVRTVAEFAAGRPKGKAVNVPWLFYYPGTRAEHPNESFLLVIETLFPKEAPLILGCSDDARAMAAAARVIAAGYQNVRVLAGGIDGWRASHRMTTTDNRPGISYVSLLTQVKRPAGKKGGAGHGH